MKSLKVGQKERRARRRWVGWLTREARGRKVVANLLVKDFLTIVNNLQLDARLCGAGEERRAKGEL